LPKCRRDSDRARFFIIHLEEKEVKNPIKQFVHLVKDPINTIEEAETRQKETTPWLFGSLGAAVLLFLIVVILGVLLISSRISSKNDPMSLVKNFNEKDYRVQMWVNNEDIKDMADGLEVRSNGIICYIAASPSDIENLGEAAKKAGVFFCCKDNKTAKKLQADLEAFVSKEEEFQEFVRGIVVRDGKIVFMGCEDVWEERK